MGPVSFKPPHQVLFSAPFTTHLYLELAWSVPHCSPLVGFKCALWISCLWNLIPNPLFVENYDSWEIVWLQRILLHEGKFALLYSRLVDYHRNRLVIKMNAAPCVVMCSHMHFSFYLSSLNDAVKRPLSSEANTSNPTLQKLWEINISYKLFNLWCLF